MEGAGYSVSRRSLCFGSTSHTSYRSCIRVLEPSLRNISDVGKHIVELSTMGRLLRHRPIGLLHASIEQSPETRVDHVSIAYNEQKPGPVAVPHHLENLARLAKYTYISHGILQLQHMVLVPLAVAFS